MVWHMYMCRHKLQMIKLFIFVLNCTRKTVICDNVVLYFIPDNQFHNYFTSIISLKRWYLWLIPTPKTEVYLIMHTVHLHYQEITHLALFKCLFLNTYCSIVNWNLSTLYDCDTGNVVNSLMETIPYFIHCVFSSRCTICKLLKL